MKIAITALGSDINSQMDPRFGRGKYILIVDTDTIQVVEVIENPNIMASGGAGVQTSQLVIDKGAEAVITSHAGPNATKVLKTAGIDIYSSPIKSVAEIIQDFNDNKLKKE